MHFHGPDPEDVVYRQFPRPLGKSMIWVNLCLGVMVPFLRSHCRLSSCVWDGTSTSKAFQDSYTTTNNFTWKVGGSQRKSWSFLIDIQFMSIKWAVTVGKFAFTQCFRRHRMCAWPVNGGYIHLYSEGQILFSPDMQTVSSPASPQSCLDWSWTSYLLPRLQSLSDVTNFFCCFGWVKQYDA